MPHSYCTSYSDDDLSKVTARLLETLEVYQGNLAVVALRVSRE